MVGGLVVRWFRSTSGVWSRNRLGRGVGAGWELVWDHIGAWLVSRLGVVVGASSRSEKTLGIDPKTGCELFLELAGSWSGNSLRVGFRAPRGLVGPWRGIAFH